MMKLLLERAQRLKISGGLHEPVNGFSVIEAQI